MGEGEPLEEEGPLEEDPEGEEPEREEPEGEGSEPMGEEEEGGDRPEGEEQSWEAGLGTSGAEAGVTGATDVTGAESGAAEATGAGATGAEPSSSWKWRLRRLERGWAHRPSNEAMRTRRQQTPEQANFDVLGANLQCKFAGRLKTQVYIDLTCKLDALDTPTLWSERSITGLSHYMHLRSAPLRSDCRINCAAVLMNEDRSTSSVCAAQGSASAPSLRRRVQLQPEPTLIKQEPEERRVKQEERPPQFTVCVTAEDISAHLHKQEERPSQVTVCVAPEDICADSHLNSETDAQTQNSEETDNDEDWAETFSCSEAQLEFLGCTDT
ncbi:hypothetical protein WMY93_033540 [Mugilogobius chulae]|uniref:Uncharacterized protein n=1 Tax=Mugilogobius chulae TaxID=88201 RepID=A0AAW0MTK0_9GOBI